MRTAAIAAAVVAAFVGVMYLRFASDSVPGQPPGAAVGGSQCVVFRNVSDAEDAVPARTCGAGALADVPPAIQPPAPTFTPTSLPRQ